MQTAQSMSLLGEETAFEVFAKAKALEDQGIDMLHMELAESDFDTGNAVRLRFTADTPGVGGNSISIQVSESDLGFGVAPTIGVVGSTITVVLNTHATSPTTAKQLVDALNLPPAAALIDAEIVSPAET